MKVKDKIIRWGFIPQLLRLLHPGFSYCEKCRLPWNYCNSKSVDYNESSGTFATCDICWNNSTIEELKKYYTIVYYKQLRSMMQAGYKMDHSLGHLLDCVEKEFDKTNTKEKKTRN